MEQQILVPPVKYSGRTKPETKISWIFGIMAGKMSL